MKFVYLVQGQAHLVERFFHLQERAQARALFLTYDKELSGAIFFPQSTWAEGRNKLLQTVDEQDIDYDYLIFVDDDTHFYLGDWDSFEQGLQCYRPAIGVPVFDRTVATVLPFPLFPVQSFTYNDEQLMAFSRTVVEQRTVLPYQTHFDSLHWWATCRLQQVLIQNFYASDVLQLNFVRVSNLETRRYSVNTLSDELYRGQVIKWVRQRYSRKFKDVNKTPSKSLLLVRTLWMLTRKMMLAKLLNWQNIRLTFRKVLDRRKEVGIERLLAHIDSGSYWVLYGFGDVGRCVYEYVRCNKQDIEFAVVDKAAINQSYQVDDVQVRSPQSLINQERVRVVVATFSFKDEIEAYLVDQLGLCRRQLLFLKPFALGESKVLNPTGGY